MEAKVKVIPPYISYRTFENFLLELKARGLPSRIDRSILANKSGTIQSQLLLAFNYLGLASDSGRPTERLQKLVKAEGAAMKGGYREMLASAYSFVLQSDLKLETATPHEIEALFKDTGASGETVRRSISFFIALARKAGVAVSPYIKPHRGKKSSKADSPSAEMPISAPASAPVELPAKKAVVAKRIQLQSGGSLTLELSLDLFELDPKDREFVFELIDRLNEYAG
ncbi:MAG: DUF5343 domain-containing protein [Acidobacteriota bacterium]|nr:MAG: DUF5343 domain-containing protein [Acidobacteriota bacterium]